jgi:putative hydrolase of the HAD superfamily
MKNGIFPNRGQFKHIESWVFDLDNTLYPESCALFDQIEKRMGLFVQEFLGFDTEAEAKVVQKKYFREHGTTLRGLMDVDGVNPKDYLAYCHDIDYSNVAASPRLNSALDALSGRKFIFTNGDKDHSSRVLKKLGVEHHFSGCFDIIDSDFVPKPGVEPYKSFFSQFDIDPASAAFFEDSARNLETGHALGMTTVHIETQSIWAMPEGDTGYIHHSCVVIEDFLEEVLAKHL